MTVKLFAGQNTQGIVNGDIHWALLAQFSLPFIDNYVRHNLTILTIEFYQLCIILFIYQC